MMYFQQKKNIDLHFCGYHQFKDLVVILFGFRTHFVLSHIFLFNLFVITVHEISLQSAHVMKPKLSPSIKSLGLREAR